MKGFKKIDLTQAYKLLEGCETILVCTKGKNEGQYNVTPYGWFTTYDYEPVTKVLFSSDPTHQACANIQRTKEYAICIPKNNSDPIIFKCGEISSPEADKFKELGLTGVMAEKTDAKVLPENSRAILEMKLARIIKEGSVELYLGEAVEAWECE